MTSLMDFKYEIGFVLVGIVFIMSVGFIVFAQEVSDNNDTQIVSDDNITEVSNQSVCEDPPCYNDAPVPDENVTFTDEPPSETIDPMPSVIPDFYCEIRMIENGTTISLYYGRTQMMLYDPDGYFTSALYPIYQHCILK